MSAPFTFGSVGSGRRAEFFARLARLLPDHRHPAMGPLVQKTRHGGLNTHLFQVKLRADLQSEFMSRGNTRDAVCFTVFREAGRGR